MKTIICVDFQPEYIRSFDYLQNSFVKYINSRKCNIIFLYNGEFLGFPNEIEYKQWLEDIGIKNVNKYTFFDKGYAFFRDFMDMGMYEENIVKIGKNMIENNINDSRDLPEDYIYENYDFNTGGNSIYIPEVYKFIKDQVGSNLFLCGGGKNECLKEVEILLQIANKDYKLINEYIY